MIRRYVDRTTASLINAENNGDVESTDEVIIHHVPFKLEYEGQANVDAKFTSKSRPFQTDPEVLCNQFRGRPLQGKKIDLPSDYEGLVALDLKKSISETIENDDGGTKEETEISIIKRFDSMTFWNWDRVPSCMDKHVKLMDWIQLSDVLHSRDEEDCDVTSSTVQSEPTNH